ncbi:MFS transporter, ACS family, glucarate transporter [Actinopolyspora mzabensis]|uniref:MFS transporter, ACS family, glucarate transporter n=1 Tax=Actinopolyspora mzabensis TaxID=995066 RepID=A0A1G8VCU6_ACTMZ|nr:MFS transporter [Actinopolyspora mzabensis]SDJ63936.1 MFS transporter, ACS family, glucarate transporter [Actinopolyspora mzabensis]
MPGTATSSTNHVSHHGRTPRLPTRLLVLGLLFVITAVIYAGRGSLSITGDDMAADLGFSTVQLGYVFSAFGWSYVLAQLPGGILLDRFGARRVYTASIVLWTLATAAISLVGLLTTSVLVALAAVFLLRLLLGAFESPALPANARVVTMWFPTAERGWATAVFTSAQYLATAMFAPLMGWVTHEFGWRWVFVLLGVCGVVLAASWTRWMRSPTRHPRVSSAELAHMESGGALTGLDDPLSRLDATVERSRTANGSGPAAVESADRSSTGSGGTEPRPARLDRGTVRRILSARPLWGVYVTQYAINALTYFFITWLPVYLVRARGLSLLETGFTAAIPALSGLLGGLLGGWLSDRLIRRGHSLTAARKTPSVIGMSLVLLLVLCTLTDSTGLILTILAIAFFGKGLGALGWAITTDIAPPRAASFVGGTMNAVGNAAGIVTPVVIGYTLSVTGSFDAALWFVGAHGLLALCGFGIMGEIHRIRLEPR